MKVLCEYTPGGPHYVRSGWLRAFNYCGHDARFWIPDRKPIHDAFSEFEPDIYLGTTYGLSRALVKCLKARPQVKVGLFCSAWGSLVDDLDPARYPIVRVTDDEKRVVADLKESIGRPDFVFTHVTGRFLEGTLGGWRNVGVEPIGVLNAYDILAYPAGKSRPELACDVMMTGGYWPFKARNLDRYVLPLCQPDKGLNVKIFGSSPWPVSQYLGPLAEEDVSDAFASATVCINVSEPHSTDLGWDTIERPYKVLGNGTSVCVSDYVEEAAEIFSNEELVFARTPMEFEEAIRHFVANPDDRLGYMRRGRETVLRGHTYFHRIKQMLDGFGLFAEGQGVLAAYERLGA